MVVHTTPDDHAVAVVLPALTRLLKGLDPVIVTVADTIDVAGYITLARRSSNGSGRWLTTLASITCSTRTFVEVRRCACADRTERDCEAASCSTSAGVPDQLARSGAERPRHWCGSGVGTEVEQRLDSTGLAEVITFSEDHPAAAPSGARKFYERLAFTASEPADAGPDGTPRQWYRKRLNS
jgi:hypothetical protein